MGKNEASVKKWIYFIEASSNCKIKAAAAAYIAAFSIVVAGCTRQAKICNLCNKSISDEDIPGGQVTVDNLEEKGLLLLLAEIQ